MKSSRASGRVRAGRGVWLGIAGCLLFAGCTIERADVRTPSGESPEADTSRVRAAVEAIADAIERDDRSALDTLYHDSLVVYRSGRVQHHDPGAEDRPILGLRSFGIDSGGGDARSGGAPGRRLVIEDLAVRLRDGTAWATFRFHHAPTGDGVAGEPTARGLATVILRQTDGGWQLIHVHISGEG